MAYPIFLYSVTFCGAVLPAGAPNGDPFEAPLFRVANILEIDAWCRSHRGKQRLLNASKAGPPSAHASHYFSY